MSRNPTRARLTAEPRLLWDYKQWAERISHTSLEDFACKFIRSRWDTLGLLGARPDGIVIMDDTMARGAADALEAQGVRVGRDIQLAARSTRHSPVLAAYEDRMHLLLIDPDESARIAFEMLECLMAGRTPAERRVLIRAHVQEAGG